MKRFGGHILSSNESCDWGASDHHAVVFFNNPQVTPTQLSLKQKFSIEPEEVANQLAAHDISPGDVALVSLIRACYRKRHTVKPEVEPDSEHVRMEVWASIIVPGQGFNIRRIKPLAEPIEADENGYGWATEPHGKIGGLGPVVFPPCADPESHKAEHVIRSQNGRRAPFVYVGLRGMGEIFDVEPTYLPKPLSGHTQGTLDF